MCSLPILNRFLQILTTVFPTGVCAACRRALFVVLFDEFSERNLAALMAEFLDEERVIVMHEANRAKSLKLADADKVVTVKELLSANGWEFLDED